MTRLSVNLNKIALLRNSRTIGIPSVIKAAKIVVEAGADGVTVHPRPDERHIKYADAYQLAEMLTVEYNIEGNPFTGKYMEMVRDIRPEQATLVPDLPGANTSDHGWNLQADGKRLEPVINELKNLGIRVSVFMDSDVKGIELAGEIGADRVELYTEPYARAFENNRNPTETLRRYKEAAKLAQSLGMGVNAGHDLNLDNLGKFCSEVRGVLEVSIGHALISDAIEMGLATAVKKYLKILTDVKTE